MAENDASRSVMAVARLSGRYPYQGSRSGGKVADTGSRESKGVEMNDDDLQRLVYRPTAGDRLAAWSVALGILGLLALMTIGVLEMMGVVL